MHSDEEEQNTWFLTTTNNLIAIEATISAVINSFREFVESCQGASKSSKNISSKLGAFYGVEQDESRLSSQLAQYLQLYDPLSNPQTHMALATLSNSVAISEQFYKVLVDSFKDRSVIREVLRTKYQKMQPQYKKALKKTTSASNQKIIQQFEAIRQSYNEFTKELIDDLDTFFEQKQDPLDPSVVALMDVRFSLYKRTEYNNNPPSDSSNTNIFPSLLNEQERLNKEMEVLRDLLDQCKTMVEEKVKENELIRRNSNPVDIMDDEETTLHGSNSQDSYPSRSRQGSGSTSLDSHRSNSTSSTGSSSSSSSSGILVDESSSSSLSSWEFHHLGSSSSTSTSSSSSSLYGKLKEFLQDPDCLRYFKRFLSAEFAEENLQFWLEVEEYKKIGKSLQTNSYDSTSISQRIHKAQDIFEKYLRVNSPKEINLSHATIQSLRQYFNSRSTTITNDHDESDIDPPPLTLFNDASKEILALIQGDSYERFLQSELCGKMQKRLKKRDFLQYQKPADYDHLRTEALKLKQSQLKKEKSKDLIISTLSPNITTNANTNTNATTTSSRTMMSKDNNDRERGRGLSRRSVIVASTTTDNSTTKSPSSRRSLSLERSNDGSTTSLSKFSLTHFITEPNNNSNNTPRSKRTSLEPIKNNNLSSVSTPISPASHSPESTRKKSLLPSIAEEASQLLQVSNKKRSSSVPPKVESPLSASSPSPTSNNPASKLIKRGTISNMKTYNNPLLNLNLNKIKATTYSSYPSNNNSTSPSSNTSESSSGAQPTSMLLSSKREMERLRYLGQYSRTAPSGLLAKANLTDSPLSQPQQQQQQQSSLNTEELMTQLFNMVEPNNDRNDDTPANINNTNMAAITPTEGTGENNQFRAVSMIPRPSSAMARSQTSGSLRAAPKQITRATTKSTLQAFSISASKAEVSSSSTNNASTTTTTTTTSAIPPSTVIDGNATSSSTTTTEPLILSPSSVTTTTTATSTSTQTAPPSYDSLLAELTTTSTSLSPSSSLLSLSSSSSSSPSVLVESPAQQPPPPTHSDSIETNTIATTTTPTGSTPSPHEIIEIPLPSQLRQADDDTTRTTTTPNYNNTSKLTSQLPNTSGLKLPKRISTPTMTSASTLGRDNENTHSDGEREEEEDEIITQPSQISPRSISNRNSATIPLPSTRLSQTRNNSSNNNKSTNNSSNNIYTGKSKRKIPTSETNTSTAVKVAVRVRPLLNDKERSTCIRTPNNNNSTTQQPQQVIIDHVKASRTFSYDLVFSPETSQASVFELCVIPLIESVFEGFNATILAYGQTGSGKTFTMGTGNNSLEIDDESKGIVPRVITEIFQRINAMKEEDESMDFKVKISFLELYNEEIRDMLLPDWSVKKEYVIREEKGSMMVAGLTELIVKNEQEMQNALIVGSRSRTTSSTLMNTESSRSHAIFTTTIEQIETALDGSLASRITSKFHFVDLAGSERLAKTKAEGIQMKEGISINSGLLALGNVISALRKLPKQQQNQQQPAHIPYRDSKLTRLLQDSLGGNSRTLMIACISPAKENFEETLNTLRYADHARQIENKTMIQLDPTSQELIQLRNQVKALQDILAKYKKGIDVIKLNVLSTPSAATITTPSSENNNNNKKEEDDEDVDDNSATTPPHAATTATTITITDTTIPSTITSDQQVISILSPTTPTATPTTEQLLARIKELEQENTLLKQQLRTQNSPNRLRKKPDYSESINDPFSSTNNDNNPTTPMNDNNRSINNSNNVTNNENSGDDKGSLPEQQPNSTTNNNNPTQNETNLNSIFTTHFNWELSRSTEQLLQHLENNNFRPD